MVRGSEKHGEVTQTTSVDVKSCHYGCRDPKPLRKSPSWPGPTEEFGSSHRRGVSVNRYVTELVGTFFLVFTIGMVVVDGTAAAPLAIGSALTALVYMGRHMSGAH